MSFGGLCNSSSSTSGLYVAGSKAVDVYKTFMEQLVAVVAMVVVVVVVVVVVGQPRISSWRHRRSN